MKPRAGRFGRKPKNEKRAGAFGPAATTGTIREDSSSDGVNRDSGKKKKPMFDPRAQRAASAMAHMAFQPAIRGLRDQIGQGRAHGGTIDRMYAGYKGQLEGLQGAEKAAMLDFGKDTAAAHALAAGATGAQDDAVLAKQRELADQLGLGPDFAQGLEGHAKAVDAAGAGQHADRAQLASSLGLNAFTNMNARLANAGEGQIAARERNDQRTRLLGQDLVRALQDKGEYKAAQTATLDDNFFDRRMQKKEFKHGKWVDKQSNRRAKEQNVNQARGIAGDIAVGMANVDAKNYATMADNATDIDVARIGQRGQTRRTKIQQRGENRRNREDNRQDERENRRDNRTSRQNNRRSNKNKGKKKGKGSKPSFSWWG